VFDDGAETVVIAPPGEFAADPFLPGEGHPTFAEALPAHARFVREEAAEDYAARRAYAGRLGRLAAEAAALEAEQAGQ
jgi:hypothetical protein